MKRSILFLLSITLLFSCHKDKNLKAEWYENVLYLLEHKYDKIKIALVWSERWENSDGSISDLRINSSEQTLEAYRNGIASDYFVGKEELDTTDGKVEPLPQHCYHGCYTNFGEYEDSVDATKLQEFEQLAGKSVAFVQFSVFFGRYEGHSLTRIEENLHQIGDVYGAVPLMRLQPWGEPYWSEPQAQPHYSMDSIINGNLDNFLTEIAQIVRRYAKPVMITFGVEMNGNWFPWSGIYQGGSQTDGFGDPAIADGPERYAAAYRHIVNLFRSQGANNAIWYFQPNSESFPGEQWNDPVNYYPGDEYVDWVGFSLYGAQTYDEEWLDFESRMDVIYNKMLKDFPNKPLMLTEWGVMER